MEKQKNGELSRMFGYAGKFHVLTVLTGAALGIVLGFAMPMDPRKEELANCFTISDKARCIAGSVLEVICEALE